MDPLFWSLILIAIGFCVVILELFVPSAGMLGILAATLIIAGISLAFVAGFKTGAIVLGVTVLFLPALLAAMIKIWPSTPIGKRILLKNLRPEDVLPESQHAPELVGQLGIAKTKMLPSGIIVVNGRKLDAVSDGLPIDTGEPIKITAIRGNHIYVEPYDGDVTDVSDLPVRDRDILSQPIEELGIDSLDEPL
jgi:membrane-bound ClpP family serine protease